MNNLKKIIEELKKARDSPCPDDYGTHAHDIDFGYKAAFDYVIGKLEVWQKELEDLKNRVGCDLMSKDKKFMDDYFKQVGILATLKEIIGGEK